MSHGYIYGYKKAADKLVQNLDKKHSEIDYLVYPIIFLYRHHIELILKNLLALNIQLSQSKEKIPKNHKIRDIWPRVKGHYRQINQGQNSKELKFVDNIIEELDTIDPDSMNFRYSRDTKGSKPNENLRNIDLKVFAKIIDKVSDILETFEYQVRYCLEQKWEYESLQQEK